MSRCKRLAKPYIQNRRHVILYIHFSCSRNDSIDRDRGPAEVLAVVVRRLRYISVLVSGRLRYQSLPSRLWSSLLHKIGLDRTKTGNVAETRPVNWVMTKINRKLTSPYAFILSCTDNTKTRCRDAELKHRVARLRKKRCTSSIKDEYGSRRITPASHCEPEDTSLNLDPSRAIATSQTSQRKDLETGIAACLVHFLLNREFHMQQLTKIDRKLVFQTRSHTSAVFSMRLQAQIWLRVPL